jgi:hypothetical protein
MKTLSLSVLALCLAFTHIGCDAVEPLAGPGTHPYYLYQKGDQYVVEEWSVTTGIEFKDTITYTVLEVVKLDGRAYNMAVGTSGLMYFPGEEPLPRHSDTTYTRVVGSKVMIWSSEGERTYIDFEEPYHFSTEMNPRIQYVKDTSNVQTLAGHFDDCKLMRPSNPYLHDRIYAKDVGLVKIIGDEFQWSLLSAKIGSKILP